MKKNGVRGGEGLATYLTALLWVALMMGCKPAERVVYVPEVHTVTTEVVTHDTVIVTAIPEHYAERETLDTLSELSNPFAFSRAEVSCGKLTHSLGIHPTAEVSQRVIVEEKVVTIRDSIPYRVEVPVYIEKPLEWWQVSLMWIGVVAIVVASVGVYRWIGRGGRAPRAGLG